MLVKRLQEMKLQDFLKQELELLFIFGRFKINMWVNLVIGVINSRSVSKVVSSSDCQTKDCQFNRTQEK